MAEICSLLWTRGCGAATRGMLAVLAALMVSAAPASTIGTPDRGVLIVGCGRAWCRAALATGKIVKLRVPNFTSDYGWSPDFRQLAYTRFIPYRDNRPIVIASENGSRRTLVKDEDVVRANPRWSPDGRWLLYSTNDGAIHIIPARGGKSIRVGRGDAAWSPRGTISWTNRRGIWVTKPQPVRPRLLVPYRGRNGYQTPSHLGSPRWSPDGKWLLYLEYPPDCCPNYATADQTRAKLWGAGGTTRILLPSLAYTVSWSPNSKEILDEQSSGDISIYRLDGKRLSTHGPRWLGGNVVFSPDSAAVAYRDPQSGRIAVARVDGSNRHLTRPQTDGAIVAWITK